MDSKFVLVVLVVVLVSAEEEDIDCETGFYFEYKTGQCLQCSECTGPNMIIRSPCTKDFDTVCGPFVEFDKFNQRQIDNSKNFTYDVVAKMTPDAKGQYPTSVDKDRKWYTLAMALLGILSVISLVIIIYIVVVCFVCKKRREDKENIYDGEGSNGHPNFTTRLVLAEPNVYVNSRDRLKSTTYGDSDSNQTLSSTSSHYVYFKSADGEEPV